MAERGKKEEFLRIGVSACLVGEKVRYDGGDKRHDYVSRHLSRMCELVSICPEVAIDMGVPRPPIHLLKVGKHFKAVGVDDTTLDVTQELSRFSQQMAKQLTDLHGYVFKARSPSCGVKGVKIHNATQSRYEKGAGLFAQTMLHQYPLMPIIDEEALATPAQQANFLQRASAYHRWQVLCLKRVSLSTLQRFHRQNYFSLMMHGVESLRKLDGCLASLSQNQRLTRKQLHSYGGVYMRQLSYLVTPRRQAVVLKRLANLWKYKIPEQDWQRLRNAVEDFLQGKYSLARSLALMVRSQQQYPLEILQNQTLFEQDLPGC